MNFKVLVVSTLLLATSVFADGIKPVPGGGPVSGNGAGLTNIPESGVVGLVADLARKVGTNNAVPVALTNVNNQVVATNYSGGALRRLVFIQQPTDTISGFIISPGVTVQLQDGFGNNLATDGVSITVGLAGISESLSGGLSLSTVAGLATFSNVTPNGMTGYPVLVASAAGYDSTISVPFLLDGTNAAGPLGVADNIDIGGGTLFVAQVAYTNIGDNSVGYIANTGDGVIGVNTPVLHVFNALQADGPVISPSTILTNADTSRWWATNWGNGEIALVAEDGAPRIFSGETVGFLKVGANNRFYADTAQTIIVNEHNRNVASFTDNNTIISGPAGIGNALNWDTSGHLALSVFNSGSEIRVMTIAPALLLLEDSYSGGHIRLNSDGFEIKSINNGKTYFEAYSTGTGYKDFNGTFRSVATPNATFMTSPDGGTLLYASNSLNVAVGDFTVTGVATANGAGVTNLVQALQAGTESVTVIGVAITVTFATPFPDANYNAALTPIGVAIPAYYIASQTANGFTTSAVTLTGTVGWTAIRRTEP